MQVATETIQKLIDKVSDYQAQTRLERFVEEPCHDTWDALSGRIIGPQKDPCTAWQAILRVVEGFPAFIAGNFDDDNKWPMVPTVKQLTLALMGLYGVPDADESEGSSEEPAEDAVSFGTIDQYLAEFSGEMGERVDAGIPALFDPSRDKISPEVQDIMDNPLNFDRPKPAQLLAVEGALRRLKKDGTVHLCGEPGSGKTPMGGWIIRAVAASAGRHMRTVVTCPNQLVKKWKDHADRTIPDCKSVIVGSYRDLIPLVRAGRPTQNEVWIIPRDKGKLSYAWRPGIIKKQKRVLVKDAETGEEESMFIDTFHCPRCGRLITTTQKDKVVEAGIDYFGNRDGKPTTRRVCDRKEGGCGEQLWQAYNGTKDRFSPELPAPGVSPRRCAPGEFIWRQGIRFDLYIADEQHELQNESLQGKLFANLAALSDRVICATGTMTGGYASNLLHTLWRTVPRRMRNDGLAHTDQGHKEFIQTYGVLMTETKYTQKNADQSMRDLCCGRGRKASRKEKVLPGISPQLFTRMLLPDSVFVRLEEMHGDLPTFHEHAHSVSLAPAQAEALQWMTDAFNEHVERMKASGEPCRAWSAIRACLLRWPDRPWPTYTIYDRDREHNKIKVLDVPELSQNVEYPKERRLRRLIRLEKARGRKCCVFTEMTGPVWRVTDRLQTYLESNGIRVLVLQSEGEGGPKPEDRDQWIKDRMDGYDVLICNPKLVMTGLDLYSTPTIIFYYCGDSTYVLRQAARRAWRLGQTQACVVHYLTYRKVDALAKSEASGYLCIQSAALSLMAKKMSASLALEGDFSSEGLAAMSDSDDMASQLAKVIAGKLQTEDPKVAMAKYREKLEKMMPSIVRDIPKDAAEPQKPAAIAEPVALETPRIPEPKFASVNFEVPVSEKPAAVQPSVTEPMFRQKPSSKKKPSRNLQEAMRRMANVLFDETGVAGGAR